MDFKSLISQLDQLNEATTKTKTGLKHTAEPGGYGRKDDEDEEGNKVKDKSAEKKGKGRPKKATSTSGEDKKYDFSAFGVTKGKDVKLPKYDKKKTKKHSIKEYLDQMYEPLNEMGITVKPMPGASQIIGADGKPMGTADAATANTIKQASEKGTLKLGGDEEMKEGDIGKHNNATTGFDALVKKLTPKYGKEAATKIAGSQLKKIKEADQPPRDALASPLTLEAKKAKPDANKNGIPDYAEDGKGKNDLKKKKVKEGMDQKLNAARAEGKAHGLRGHSHCGKNYEDMEEARCYHEGYKEGLDECYGQVPIQGYVGETTPVVNTMASYGAEEGELAEADIEESPFTWAAKNTPKGSKFSLGGKEFVKNDAFAFEALDKQLNALLEDKEVTEGMTVSISKGQQGTPDSVSVSAQDGEADQLLSVIKSAGLGLFGGDDVGGHSDAGPMTVASDDEPAEIGAGGDAIEVVGDHDGMMNLMKKLSGIGGGEHSHGEDEACEVCGESPCGCDEEQIDEVESEDQMTYQMAEDNPPDSGADNTQAAIADTTQANDAAAAYNPSDDIDEGSEASPVANDGIEAGDAEEEMKASMNEAETDDGELTKEPGMSADQEQKDGLDLEESSFANLYRKLAMLSEESTSEKDDKAEKAAKKVAKDIEYDEGHKGKDDDKAEEAGKKVKKDIEYDDKKDKKEKKLDEWANDAGPGKSVSDTTFETDIDFMMNVISGGLNKRKQTGQTTIPVVASQLGRQVSRNTTDINESADSVSDWKKLAGLK